LFALGIAWTIAAFGVFFRDLTNLTQFFTMILMYASGVFYSAQRIPAPMWRFLRFNPLLLTIELARDVTLWDRPVSWKLLIYLYISGALTCYAGFVVFRRLKSAFADVL
jgi:lipopolysaccharide transport system permease protein